MDEKSFNINNCPIWICIVVFWNTILVVGLIVTLSNYQPKISDGSFSVLMGVVAILGLTVSLLLLFKG